MSDKNGPNYKETLSLPNTDFPMKANLPQKEPQLIEKWNNNKLYEKMIEKNQGNKTFIMPDGPPYANGNIHIGHALNKILKDIIIKYRNMQGQQAAFIPGWDCHGLPIELNVTKKLGKHRKEKTDSEVRDLCREEAQKWVELQKEQFIRLGILAEWDQPYLTLQPAYEAEEMRVLGRILENGILYQGRKPVYWCSRLQTALAAAEVEYHDHKSLSVYVKFQATPESLEKLGSPDKTISFVIWTTTPWTLPANQGIALNANFEYGAYDTGSEYIIIAKKAKERFEEENGLELTEWKTFKGSELEKLSAQHPFISDRQSLIILGDHVTLESGSGCVHTAPGHGADDYYVGAKYKLPIYSPVDPAGRFTDEVDKYAGMKIEEANPIIVEDLKASGHLISVNEITHSYPHNPRTKTPLIFRSTPQWFIEMDNKDFPLRQKALNLCEGELEFVPSWGHKRLKAMISNTPDWCISRQRTWGVPIPVYYCEDCDTPLADKNVINRLADEVEANPRGLEAYFEASIEKMTEGKKCSSCSSTKFRRGKDILDVWFDSGVCHSAVQKKRKLLDFPADIYIEGSDQHRGWFQTSLLSSLAAYDQAPYKALITHGFVNDSQGLKMSKSKGNTIGPAEVIKQSGAEILRLWVAYEDYGQDVTIGKEMFKRISETYRRIRNTTRFLLGNLSDFDPTKDQVKFEDMPEIDQWALVRLNKLIDKTTESYENYDFYKVYHALNYFFTVDLSATYLDILKDRLYTWKKDGLERKSSQTVFYHLLENLTALFAPILSFLAEEVYTYIPGDKKESIFLVDFPKSRPEWKNENLEAKFTELFEIRSAVSKKLEDMRKNKEIGSSLEAKIKITAKADLIDKLQSLQTTKHADNLCEFFIVSSVDLAKAEGPVSIEVEKATGEKCKRCWNYHADLSTINQLPDLCPKCVEAVQ